MDFNLKKWRDQQQESEEEQQPSSIILRQEEAALPLFVSAEPQPQPNKFISHLSDHPHHSSSPTSIPTSVTRFPKGVERGCCFSVSQWQELEVQALIFKHMVAGSAVPHELLQLVKKSLLSSSICPYYFHNYSAHLQQPAFLQGGYWGKGGMDAEPGRCRRTDGKKWRCSRDVVAGHKYCERHIHRGRNRSRKPVEFPPSASAGGGGVRLSNKSSATFSLGSVGGGGGSGGGGSGSGGSNSGGERTQFWLSSGSGAASHDAFKLSQGSSDFQHESHPGEIKSNSRVLRHFFEDWPTTSHHGNSSTSLSMSTTDNHRTSDFLRLSTGNGHEQAVSIGLGGPLAEALRSSTTSSPTSCSISVASLLCS